MQKLMGEGELLDARGRLIAPGYATHEARRYRRGAIKAGPLRIKEWDYYCVLTDRYGFALTIADNDYMGFLGVTWLDFGRRAFASAEALTPFPMGGLALPETANDARIAQARGGIDLAIVREAGVHRLSARAPGFDGGRGFSLDVALNEQRPLERMTIATPFANAPSAFYYNQKINCLAAEGEAIIGGERFIFAPQHAHGVLDWGRGVWTYDNTWYWGSASGLVNGRRFGFNIGYGFGDASAASENMIFFDGRAHKLNDVTFHMPPGAPDSAPWRFTSSDGRFEMQFEPVLDRASRADIGLIKSDQHQVFGRFSGRAVLDDGARLEIENLIGFAEKVQNRW